MMYKVFLRYPEALRPAFPKLKEKLEDADPGTYPIAQRVMRIEPSTSMCTNVTFVFQVCNQPL